MEKFRLTAISQTGNTNFAQGTFLILLNAVNVPPHLLLSINGFLYSLTDAGRQMGSPLEKMLAFIERKKIPTLFVEWQLPENWNAEKLESEIRKNFLKYERVVEGKASCLFPIRDVAATVWGNELKQARFIFELLPMMQKKNAIGKTFALNMQHEIGQDGSFELKTYNEDQLSEALHAAKQG